MKIWKKEGRGNHDEDFGKGGKDERDRRKKGGSRKTGANDLAGGD